MTVYHPPQTTERESDGSWEDCTWATGVDIQNAVHSATVAPPTRAEYEALRVAGGDGPAEHTNDGSNYDQLCRGMAIRYGWRPTLLSFRDWGTVWDILSRVGTVMGVQGSLASLPTHLRRWDPSSTVAHSVCVIHDETGLWWMNPLAPASYPGEYVNVADVAAFYNGLHGSGAVVYSTVGSRALPATDTEEIVKKLNSNGLLASDGTPLTRLPVAAGTQFTTVDNVVGKFSGAASVPVLAYVGDTVDRNYLVLVTTSVGWPDGVARDTPVVVHSGAALVSVPAPTDATPYSKADLDAARAAGRESFRADVEKLP